MTKINTTAAEENQRDINDIFDDIVLTEEKLTEQGYEEGFTDGINGGNTEGYHLGYHRGAELGAELGYYLGIVTVHLLHCQKSEKILTILNNLKVAIEAFPKINDEHIDIFEEANKIRAQYRRVCALLKVNGKYPEADELNF